MLYTLEVVRFYQDPDRLEDEVARALFETEGITEVIVDMDTVTFILSSCITQVVKLFRHCRKEALPFKVINAAGVLSTFEALRLTSLFEVTP